MAYLSTSNRHLHPLPELPTPAELQAIRLEMIQRVNAAADRAWRTQKGEPIGMPHKLFEVGCYLAGHGFTDDPCEGERQFNTDFRMYREFAAAPTLTRYFRDPAFAAELDAETQRNRDAINASIDAGMSALNARQQARWEAEAGEAERAMLATASDLTSGAYAAAAERFERVVFRQEAA